MESLFRLLDVTRQQFPLRYLLLPIVLSTQFYMALLLVTVPQLSVRNEILYSEQMIVLTVKVITLNFTVSPFTTSAYVYPTPTSSQPKPGILSNTLSRNKLNTAAIVGGAVGGVCGMVAVITIILFILRLRTAWLSARGMIETHEKPQLHSDDVQPDRKEQVGTQAPRAMLEKRPTDISEMPWNEEILHNGLKEMPSNKIPGNKLETTENEVAVLDRMARLTGSTTLTGDNTTDDTANHYEASS